MSQTLLAQLTSWQSETHREMCIYTFVVKEVVS